MSPRSLGLLLGALADRVVPDPQRGHPVAIFGSLAGGLELRVYGPSRRRGVLHVAVLVGSATVAGVLVERATRGHPLLGAAATALATWTVLGGTSLEREAHAVADLLAAGDLPRARLRLTHLVGRDPTDLDESEIARAVVESVAENTSDAVVAPLVLGALAGIPGLLGYRAANTLDAMVGHHDARYARFGTPAARLDDALNLLPARLTGLLTIAVAPLARGSPAETLRIWRRDRNAAAPGWASTRAV